ncbi:MAG: endonuclease/exonuclease/phosphatase family protein [Kiritimatiellae bacterium]|nr:endonuclease/exonuclease/phosphatase family protein [Kiritimatiellia bacterium]
MKRFVSSLVLLMVVAVAASGDAAPRGKRATSRTPRATSRAPRTTIVTWNGNWFPSGRAEHRAHPDVEAATTVAAGRMLAASLRAADPSGSNAVILVLNEIRGPRSASNLIERVGIPGLRLASISAYRRRDRFDQQQDVIATTLPVVDHGWSTWRSEKRETPPRGYAYADVVVSPAVTARVYAVHLKSNYGATTKETRELNRAKRAHAVEQLVGQDKKRRYVIVAGDMNADAWRKEFAEESIFGLFAGAGFDNHLAALPPDRRGTHPSASHGDSALDYIMTRGFVLEGEPCIEPAQDLSDHSALSLAVSPRR